MRALALSIPLLFGCAAGTPAPATPESPPPATSPAPSAPQAPPESAEIRIPPPPASCSAFASKRADSKSCPDAIAKLGAALALADAPRDAALVDLEGCSELVAGVVRALRIELGPTECGDALAEGFGSAGAAPEMRDTLRGLALAAQASRLVRDPPKLAAPFGKERVMEFVKGPLADWIGEQAAAVYHVSLAGSALAGYGKAVVAIEAGLADMRFVEVVREAPIPDEIRGNASLSEAYFATLDEALEPRKVRGRDAALVGLEKLADVGVLSDPRVDRARSLLSKVYAGRRIDALDALLVPELAPAAPKSPEQMLAARIPTFYVPLLLPKLQVTDPVTLRALLERGLPAGARAELERGKAPPEAERLYARALFELGRRYWRSADFARAKELAARNEKRGADMPLVAAIGDVLAKGPKNAAQMIVGGPHLPSGVGQVAALDQVGKSHRSIEGHAAFDAAMLLELARPANADAKYFEDVANRYAVAEKKLPPEHRKTAAERKKAAEEIARAIAKPVR
jgi:hypothetical protein